MHIMHLLLWECIRIVHLRSASSIGSNPYTCTHAGRKNYLAGSGCRLRLWSTYRLGFQVYGLAATYLVISFLVWMGHALLPMHLHYATTDYDRDVDQCTGGDRVVRPLFYMVLTYSLVRSQCSAGAI